LFGMVMVASLEWCILATRRKEKEDYITGEGVFV